MHPASVSEPATAPNSGPWHPPALVAAAAGQICGLSGLLSANFFLFFTAAHNIPELFNSGSGLILTLAAATILNTGHMTLRYIWRRQIVSASVTLKFGLIWLFSAALAFSLIESQFIVLGSSQWFTAALVAVWIPACALIVSLPSRLILVLALACVASWPLAVLLHAAFGAGPAGSLLIPALLPFASALWTYRFGGRLYQMEAALHQAHGVGNYEFQEMIGQGAMGQVWRARHRVLNREAAVKVIRMDLIASQSRHSSGVIRRRFENEARAMAALRSPHTVTLYDYGATTDGSFFFSMELLDGIDLEQLVSQYGPLSSGRVAHILLQCCDSLEEAHRAGQIHRDIKPTNLFVCRVGMSFDFVKLLDFGLVRITSEDADNRVTREGQTTGTPAYMAPEIALGRPDLDGRADLYSLGCVAYFLLTGRTVFDEVSPTAQAVAHVQKPPVPPSQFMSGPIHEGLEKIILRCLEKEPAKRFRSAQALAAELERLGDLSPWNRDDAVNWWQQHQPAAAALRTSPADDESQGVKTV